MKFVKNYSTDLPPPPTPPQLFPPLSPSLSLCLSASLSLRLMTADGRQNQADYNKVFLFCYIAKHADPFRSKKWMLPKLGEWVF